ncbi:MAG: Zn-ribbon domain-containing OB-fold protein [Candidatus Binatia bacterium]|nr:Zn-ribbon domain-containing OB-fold protein [Candidatus Binatia bacterium]
MTTYTKPLPAISSLNRPYWEALKRHELKLQRCTECGKVWYPPAPFCPACWSDAVTWQRLSGRGRVNSWVVFHQAYFPSFQDDLPYNVAEVELEEGPRLLTNLVGVDLAEIRIGMPVEVVFEDVTPEITLAKFRPVEQHSR